MVDVLLIGHNGPFLSQVEADLNSRQTGTPSTFLDVGIFVLDESLNTQRRGRSCLEAIRTKTPKVILFFKNTPAEAVVRALRKYGNSVPVICLTDKPIRLTGPAVLLTEASRSQLKDIIQSFLQK